MKLIVVALAAFIIAGCQSWDETKANIAFTASGCDPTASLMVETVKIEVIQRDVFLQHGLIYPCCAHMEARLREEGNVLDIMLWNVGEKCRCNCPYTINTTLLNIKEGEYVLNIYGIQYKDTDVPTLRYSVPLIIPDTKAWTAVIDVSTRSPHGDANARG